MCPDGQPYMAFEDEDGREPHEDHSAADDVGADVAVAVTRVFKHFLIRWVVTPRSDTEAHNIQEAIV